MNLTDGLDRCMALLVSFRPFYDDEWHDPPGTTPAHCGLNGARGCCAAAATLRAGNYGV